MSGKSHKKLKITLVTIGILLVVSILALFAYGAIAVSSDKVMSGVSVGKTDLSDMDESEALRTLTRAYDANDINVKLKCEDLIFDIYGSSFALKTDIEGSCKEALGYGRDGNLFENVISFYKLKLKPVALDLNILCDYNVLQYAINEKLGERVQDVQQYWVAIGENELTVYNGQSGRQVKAQTVVELISKAIINGKLTEPIEIKIEEVAPDKINIDRFIEEYNREPKDAYVTESDGAITITPEVIGVKIEPDSARQLLEANKDSKEGYTIPALITKPKISYAELEAEYLDTLIGSYSSDYSTSSANRKTNIHLASAKINGLSLNPGEVFSFNNVVGPRTAANGYRVAHVYSNNKVVDGIGGGICQVSSTLYNAVVLADMEIVSRTNHSLPVSYVPLGRDATVSYGSIDFKIRNNKETPLKFEVLHDGSTLTINVYGRKKYKKDISIETVITGSIPYSTTNIEDSTMFEGETKVVEKGVNGTKTEAYKIVRESGQVVSRTLLCKSSYSPTTRLVRVGTKKKPVAENIPATAPIPTPEPIPPATPDIPAEPAPVAPADTPAALSPAPDTADVQIGSGALE